MSSCGQSGATKGYLKTVRGMEGFEDKEDLDPSSVKYSISFMESHNSLLLIRYFRQNEGEVLSWKRYAREDDAA